jgi:signal transduction histidine kinase
MDLNKAVTETCARYKDKADTKNILMKKDIPEPFMIFSDNEMFTTILDNLISNAVEYSRHNSSVGISVANEGLDFTLSILNSAENLTNDDLPMIFDRFWRKDKVRTPDTSHCDLGLSIVKSLFEFLSLKIETKLIDGDKLVMIISGHLKAE